MSEELRERNTEPFEGLADEAGALYASTLSDYKLHSDFLDARHSWDKQLKARCIEKFETTKILQKVPAWQKLVGGSVEKEEDITADQKAYINQEVTKFIKEFKENNNLV